MRITIGERRSDFVRYYTRLEQFRGFSIRRLNGLVLFYLLLTLIFDRSPKLSEAIRKFALLMLGKRV